MNISCKSLVNQLLKDKEKVIDFKVGGDTYYVFRGLSIPFLYTNSINNGNLCVLSNRLSNHLEEEAMSEWVTPSGLRQLIDKFKKYSLDEYTYDDSEIEVNVLNVKDIFSEISWGNIIRNFQEEISKDLEFMDLDITEDMSEDEIDKLFHVEYQRIYDEYTYEIIKNKDYLSNDAVDTLLKEIRKSIY
ncbi:hypothetical protein [Clostridium sp.]|uniref:hypothetical protein n=1 Tax=Clostridium sp. TaxID=1506 RepID=UPI001B734AAE|nr:hypothetical protein [Clostridium sp.]MBP3915618.1 hypothetical protein [Clostridium sp.]